ncbi:hypothetical protein [Moritella sp. 24]|uniref:hypothetical protein n=1 Tax=Moritella sp. 24 TaxID=2746230 RepID=UPI002102EC1F|nr:hypothetical protein [Moritella sp. 24]
MFKFLDLKIGIFILSSSNAVGPPAKDMFVVKQNIVIIESNFKRLKETFKKWKNSIMLITYL